ncbi:PepSY domain-containing protein [Bacillus sp. B1-b2]|uniref:PepSY domain-containing protein n=1 Tax=Bacillus sp. B1-b2 TaxID=2653201 RepID=UPI00186A520A|nr:PepSY domain-containing protein [Bacillus sp. B1-b2]
MKEKLTRAISDIKKSKWKKTALGLLLVCGIGFVVLEIMDERTSYASKNPINNVLPLTTEVSKNEAVTIAEENTNRLVEEVDLETDENGQRVYHVEFDDDLEEIYINSEDGNVITKADMTNNIKITEDQAKEIALKDTEGVVTEFSLDEEAGQIIYELEVTQQNGNEVDLEISAQTGQILKKDID